MQTIGVGLIGFGLSGSVFHAPLLTSLGLFQLRAVVTSRRAAVETAVPGCAVLADIPSLLARADVDLVIVAGPNHLHFEHAFAALNAGKHVVVEKPFVTEVAQGETLIDLAKKQGLILSVFQNRRWDCDFLTLRKLLADGRLGEVSLYEARFDRFRPQVADRWKESPLPGGGNFFDLGSHLIDQALVLFGWPDALWCDLETQRQGAVNHDYFHLVLRYGKRRVILHAGSLVSASTPHLAVHGTRGSYLKYGLDPQEEWLKIGLRPGDAGWGEERPDAYGRLVTASEDVPIKSLPGAYDEYYRELAMALKGQGEVPVTASQALDVVRLIHMAIAQNGRGWFGSF